MASGKILTDNHAYLNLNNHYFAKYYFSMLSGNLTTNYPHQAFVPSTFSKGQPLAPYPLLGNNGMSLPLAKSSSYSEPFYPSALQVGGPAKFSSNFSNS